MWLILGFLDSVGRLDTLTVPAALFWHICRGFEEENYEGPIDALHPDVDGSGCNFCVVFEGGTVTSLNPLHISEWSWGLETPNLGFVVSEENKKT